MKKNIKLEFKDGRIKEITEQEFLNFVQVYYDYLEWNFEYYSKDSLITCFLDNGYTLHQINKLKNFEEIYKLIGMQLRKMS